MKAMILVVVMAAAPVAVAAPATKPATTVPADLVEQLRRENAELRELVAALKTQIQVLQERQGLNPKATAMPDRLRVGMTLAEVRRFLGNDGTDDGENGRLRYYKFYEWVDRDKGTRSRAREVFVTVENDRVVSYRYGAWGPG